MEIEYDFKIVSGFNGHRFMEWHSWNLDMISKSYSVLMGDISWDEGRGN